MPGLPSSDEALLARLSHVLHDMGLPCACQEEVERTVAVFAEFEARRIRRRLLEGARERLRRLTAYLRYLEDLNGGDAAQLSTNELAMIADAFRVISSTAAEGAANLEMLAGIGSQPSGGSTS
jgi:hypothetical protein